MTLIKTSSFELAIYSQGARDAKKLALVLPGRLDTKDYAPMHSHVEYLATKGYLALSFDPPGTWESPGGLELFTTTNYIQAVHEIIEYFGNKPTFIMGHSRGGTVATLAGATNPYVSSFAPMMATYGEPSAPDEEAIKTGVKMSYRDVPPGTEKTKEQKEFALPINYFTDGQKYNPVAVLQSCTKPKLILYGTNDSFTTVEKVKQLYDRLPESKILHELHTDHDYRYHPEIIEEVNTIVGQFLEKYPI